jgi:anti-sigma regulatory factor (Ser/Thr protein kinase)
VLALGLPLEPAGLEAAQDRIEGYLTEQGASGPARYKARLVIDELMANLTMHARFATAERAARAELEVEGGGVRLRVDDTAEPYDPRAAPEPAGPPSLDDDRIGGLGLALVRKMVEIRDYRRLPEGWNRTEIFIAAA